MSANHDASLAGTAAIGCLSVWLALLLLVSARKSITVEIQATRLTHGTRIIANASRSSTTALRSVASRLHDLPKR